MTTPMSLTNREIQILRLVSEYYTVKEIGDELYITPNTVKAHIRHIYDKLGVNRRRYAVLALKEGRV